MLYGIIMRQVVATIKQSVFPVLLEGNVVGTAFRCSEEFLATCAHVSRISDQLEVEINDERYKLVEIEADKSSDVSICLFPDQAKNIPWLEIGEYDDAEEGDETIMCGFPLGMNYHVTHFGRVSAKQIINGRYGFQIDASINKGNSGGPCIILKNSKPVVIGILATRLVEADFSRLLKGIGEFKKGVELHDNNKPGSAVAKNIAKLFLSFYASIVLTINDLNRFVNVGFGEAVSVQYLTPLIKKDDAI